MANKSLSRARVFGKPLGKVSLYISAVLAAILLPLLILDMGLVFQLIVQRGAAAGSPVATPADWWWGPWYFEGEWPFFEDERKCLLALIGAGLILALIEAICLWVHRRSVQIAALSIAAQLKDAVHSQAFRLGVSEPLGRDRSRPEVLFTDNIASVRKGLIAYWTTIPYAIAVLAALLVLALSINPLLTGVAILSAVCVWLLRRWLTRRAEEQGGLQRDHGSQHNASMVEDLKVAPVATTYGLDEIPGQMFHEHLRSFYTEELSAALSKATVRPIVVLVVLLAALLVMTILGVAPQTSAAGVVVLLSALVGMYIPATRLQNLPNQTKEAEEAATELFAYLDRQATLHELPDAETLGPVKQRVTVENLTLTTRDGVRLAHEISLSIPATANVGFIASDTQTPMAMAGLFVRYYDPAAGRILFDTHDIRQAALKSIHAESALATADGLLFSGTVKENLTCGDDHFDTKQIADAARACGADEFISRLPEGYDSLLGERGAVLSRSQAFRLGLARAVLRNPSVLVIEEPAEDEDEASSQAVDLALRNVSADRTLIFLPGRINTIRLLDRIYFFHEGKIVAQGKHQQLLTDNELYRHLTYMRFNQYREV